MDPSLVLFFRDKAPASRATRRGYGLGLAMARQATRSGCAHGPIAFHSGSPAHPLHGE